MVIFIDTEKSFDEAQDGFLKKTFQQTSNRGTSMKTLQLISFLMEDDEVLFPLKLRTKGKNVCS